MLVSFSVFGLSHLSFTVSHLFSSLGSHSETFVFSPDTNSFFMSYLPISASVAFDNTGMVYDPALVITDGIFDVAKYEAYSPAFISSTLAVAYGVSFAGFTSVIVHTFR